MRTPPPANNEAVSQFAIRGRTRVEVEYVKWRTGPGRGFRGAVLPRPDRRSFRVNALSPALRNRLIGLVTEVLGPAASLPDPFPVDRQLSDLGVTSLKMVNLMLAVEIEFDIAIPQADITPENFHSVLSMEALVVRMLPVAGG